MTKPLIAAFRRPAASTVMFWSLTTLFGIWMILQYRNQWYLIIDDWTMLGSRIEHLNQFGVDDFLLRRHNEHLMAGMTLWNVGLAEVFGLRSYTPWVVTVQMGNVFVAWIVYRFAQVLDVPRLLAAISAPLFMIWGPFTTISYWAPESIFVVCLALVMLNYWLVTTGEPSIKREVIGNIFSALAIFIHSVCVAVIPVLVVVLLYRRRWRSSIITSIPILLYGLWFVTYQRLPASNRWTGTGSGDIYQERNLQIFFSFSWRTLARMVWWHSTPAAAMAVILMVAAGTVITWRRGGIQRTIVMSSLAAALVYMAGFAWSRGFVTMNIFKQDPPSRYAAVVALLLLPIALVPVGWAAAHLHATPDAFRHVTRGLGLALLVVAILASVRMREDNDAAAIPYASQTRARILSLADDALLYSYDRDEFVFGDNSWMDLTIRDVIRFKERGWL